MKTLKSKIKKKIKDWKNYHHEREKFDKEFRKKFFLEHMKNQDEIRRLRYEFHDKKKFYRRGHNELKWYHRRNRLSQVLIILFNILLWYLVFKYGGAGTIAIIFAALITIGGIIQFIFNLRLEKRIFKPISQLKKGVAEISNGNYDIEIETDIINEIGTLIFSFNEMAKKLKEGELLKKSYEDNRKTLIANISHDLKTPITSIQGYIETMLERPDISQDTINKYHQIIYSNAAYMNKLIDDLFLFSKLDMQKLELQFENISIRAFMADLMEEFHIELDERGIEFTYQDTLGRDCDASIDRKRINQVFRNIIGNAIKYGSEEDVSIKVRLYDNEKSLCIDISDNGPGIPEDKLSNIFDRFYRIDHARTKDLMSTGLGLSIAKELVEAHGGKISVISTINSGTTFTVNLPKYEAAQEK
ncbi:MAG: signal transduction histidine kinase [Eubacterium sp.]|jgi:signal transduction histidine kinase|nr:signal transduction histidine kinase [Eubacterium sp.]